MSSRYFHALVTAIAAVSPVLTASHVVAQPCSNDPVGFPTGPRANLSAFNVTDLLPHEDASGRSLLVAGKLSVPPLDASVVTSVARYQHGRLTPMDHGLPPTGANAIARIDFSSVGGPATSLYAATDADVYRWSGSTWVQAAPGLEPPFRPTRLLAFEDHLGPVLIAAGSGSDKGVLAWRGAGDWVQYAPLQTNSGPIRKVRALDDDGSPTLYAVGLFEDSSRGIANVMKAVNGAWVNVPLNIALVETVSDIIRWDDGTHGPELYLAGRFQLTDPSTRASILRLRNGQWEIVPSPGRPTPLTNSARFLPIDADGSSVLYVSFDGYLIQLTEQGLLSPQVGFTSGGQGGFGSLATAVTYDDGDGEAVYFGGQFVDIRTDLANYTNQFIATQATVIARSKQGTFESIATGLGDVRPSTPATVNYQLTPLRYQNQDLLFAGGPFARAGGRFANGAALFDGSSWTSLSLPVNNASIAAQSAVVVPIQGTQRIVVHTIQSATHLVQYWDGAQWVSLPPAGPIVTMLNLNDQLYAVTLSQFLRYEDNAWQPIASLIGPSSAIVADLGQGPRILIAASRQGSGAGVYQFDATTLTPLGPSTASNIPRAIAVHDDGSGPSLYALIPGQPSFLHRLSDSTWVPIPGGPIPSLQRFTLASFNDGRGPALYVAGQFNTLDNQPSPGLAKWQNGAWHGFSSTPVSILSTERRSLAVFNNRLYIAGDFAELGNIPADHLAYIEHCPPPCSSDFNLDGDYGTDADIEDFFACLAGRCCPTCQSADFDRDGDYGTDADIEAFFRALAGQPC